MEPRVKQYLLFMFGQWSTIENNADIVNNIKDVMETIVTEEEFTFITGDHVIIMCIKSRMAFEEIEEVLKEFLSPYINTLFLMPKPRKLFFRMDDNLKNHLFGKNKKRYKHINPKIAEILTQQLKSIVDKRVKKLKRDIDFTQKDNIIKNVHLIPMTIDNLLDKIIDYGIESLTKEEKEFLNNFNE